MCEYNDVNYFCCFVMHVIVVGLDVDSRVCVLQLTLVTCLIVNCVRQFVQVFFITNVYRMADVWVKHENNFLFIML